MFQGTKIRKVERKTKKSISFFAETEYLRRSNGKDTKKINTPNKNHIFLFIMFR